MITTIAQEQGILKLNILLMKPVLKVRADYEFPVDVKLLREKRNC